MRRTFAAAGTLIALALPATAAAGGPSPVLWGGGGVQSPLGEWTYVTVPGANGYTVVERIRMATGAVERTALLRGQFGVPAVSLDGTTTGVSADGFRLVVASPPEPGRRGTRIVVLDTDQLRVHDRITVRGFATVDAVSPTGRFIYLIRYRDDQRPVAVSAYDVARRRETRLPGKLRGVPVAQATSPDGRWSYTLFLGMPNRPPVLHVLDTSDRTARSVSLPGVHGDLYEDRMTFDDGMLQVLDGAHRELARVNLQTFAVTKPASAARHAPRAPGDGGPPWIVIGLAAFALAALGWTLGRPRSPVRDQRT